MSRGYCPTTLEERFKLKLEEAGIDYISQYPTRSGFVVDYAVFLGDRKIAIEVDGPFHDNPKGKRKDKFKDYILKREGWEVVRVPWKNLDKVNLSDLSDRV